jgi:selenide,water dikinase
MQTPETPVLRDIVLIGGGHSHAVVLHMWAMNPLPGARLTLICTDTDTPYSGMLPGFIAGHYTCDDVHIDVRRLAEFAGARYYRDEVIGIDRVARKVICRARPPVAYDALSINIGSTPKLSVPGADAHAVPVKPIRQFNQRWQALLQRVRNHAGVTTVAVVGAGAGGVELALSMQYRLRRELTEQGRNPDELHMHLLTSGPRILPTHNAAVRRRFEQVLAQRGVELHVDAEVVRVEQGRMETRAGKSVQADEVVWVTQAGGAAWLADTGLALDAAGFIRVRETLQTETDPLIFAAGDCTAWPGRPLEKAGVFAVRMGPPLAANLRRLLLGQPLRDYQPQRRWLALISTGDQHAIASRGAFYARGDWVWRWKDWIDRRFMLRFSEFPAMADRKSKASQEQIPLPPAEQTQAISALAMRCGGCGAKVGASVLSRALAQVQPIERDDVLIGLHAPDDAAVLRVAPGKALVHSVDFFRAFIDDPWIFGRIAANHALGDVFAMGAEAQSATAIATVPPGLESKVEDTLFQMMTGAVSVLNEAGCALVGGHTGEGRELALGFAVNGLVDEALVGVLTKSGLRPGDALILTKPIGTGTLLAAHAQLKARGRWIDAALDSMQVSNRAAVACLIAHGARACTDLTGFGLLGHLLEMTRPSEVDAELELSELPLLDGAAETVAAGVLSSLQPANTRLRRALRNQEAALAHPNYPLLFDPQTAGGLLAGVPEAAVADCLAQLHALGYPHAKRIGRVLPQSDAVEPITLLL